MSKNNYLHEIDIMKGITILLVVLAHVTRMFSPVGFVDITMNSEILTIFTDFIYMFHMPAFVSISGVVYYFIKREKHRYKDQQKFALDKVASRTNVDKNVTPHVFRHTMATLAMENGIELGDLQQLLGHSNPGTTLRYAEVSEERKHSAHKKFVREEYIEYKLAS